ncbi:MAG: hypothetical protein HY739_06615 [Desulfobacterales bacterium]|nr:hypothetical protein [Desulfobacterales bacterium]
MARKDIVMATQEELGARFIHALSPQAKGRIERLFRTFLIVVDTKLNLLCNLSQDKLK